jgi:hypothetical protein
LYRCLKSVTKRLIKVDFVLQAMSPDPPEHLEEAYLRPYWAARELLADWAPKTSKRSTKSKSIPNYPPKVYLNWWG